MSTHPIELFYSYADVDESLCTELEKHLLLLHREGFITSWGKRQIIAGTDWTKAQDQHLNKASVILLLISVDFVASEYCYGVEMQRAMERHEAGESHIIPILLRPVANWQGTPFGKLQPLPSNGKPITEWRNRDSAFVDVAKGIRQVLGDVRRPAMSTTPNVFPHIQNIPQKKEESGVDGDRDDVRKEQPLRKSADHKTINTQEALRLFHELMQESTEKRILCLVGEENMGKSHLLTHVLLPLAKRDYQANCALLDLNNPFYKVPDVLGQACTQLGDHYFHDYYAKEQKWMICSEVDEKGPGVISSHLNVSNKDQQTARYLTRHFIQAINQRSNESILLLFDSVERASDEMKWWLMNTLLISTMNLKHVRVIISGRSLPEKHISYKNSCQSCKLLPIEDVEEFIAYCRRNNFQLSKDGIRTLAHAFRYIPGAFVGVLPRFAQKEWTDG